MLTRIFLTLRNLAYKNRCSVKTGNALVLPRSCERLMKKVTIKLGGRNNRLVLGEGADLRNCEIRLDGEDNLIEIGARVRFKAGKIFLRHTRGQHIRIGADTTVESCYLLVDEAASIDIGEDCMLADDIMIRCGDKHSVLDATSGERVNPARDIRIAERVWIARGSYLLKGTVLQPDTVVGACSVVSRAFDEGNCVVAGVPAKIVKRGIRWDRDLL